MDSSAAVDQLSELLAQLDETPDNVPRLLLAVDLMGELGLATEQLDTLDKLSGLVMLSQSRSRLDLADRPMVNIPRSSTVQSCDRH
jgi:hypothetical protein